jgi:hypothetical protein
MADMQSQNTQGTEEKRGSGWTLVMWLLAPVVLLLIITIMSYGK